MEGDGGGIIPYLTLYPWPNKSSTFFNNILTDEKKLVFQLQYKLAIAKNKLSPQNHNRLDPSLLSQSADGPTVIN